MLHKWTVDSGQCGMEMRGVGVGVGVGVDVGMRVGTAAGDISSSMNGG